MQYSRGKKYSRDLKYDVKKLKEKKLKAKTFNKSLTINSVVFILLSFYIFYLFVFSDKNIFNFAQKEKRLEQLTEKEKKLIIQRDKLKSEIDNLKKDDFIVEKLAREQLGLTKKDEVIFIIPEDETEKEKKEEKKDRWIDRLIGRINH
ncbi:MAG: hypothetical protein DSY66_03840 [Persephonella sp.]|nr:MAG: hypothetical protein DSY53_02740 [Persephonella sp.]RUM60764.1 MAG: hypothetical protein DSY66_03840 [Persephonella sp.]